MEMIRRELSDTFRKFSSYLSLLTVFCGLLVLSGWAFNIVLLKSLAPGFVPMTPQTATCFTLLGTCLFLLNRRRPGKPLPLALFLAAVVWVIGLLVMTEYLLHVDLRIDRLLFAASSAGIGVFGGRMAPHSALNFMLASSAVLLLSQSRSRVASAQLFILMEGGVTLLALTGYAYGISSLYTYSFYKPMALHTALLFLFVFFSVLFLKPQLGVMQLVSSTSEGGRMVRRIIPVVLTVPFLLGWLIIAIVAGRAGMFPFELSLLTVLITVIFSVLIWRNALRLNATDLLRVRAEKAIAEKEEFTERLIENSTAPTFVLDTSHRVIIWNKACEKLTGVPAAKMIGSLDHWKPFYDRERPCLADVILDSNFDDLSKYYSFYGKSSILPEGWHGEGWFKNLGGRKRYIMFDAAAVVNSRGERIAVIETLQDITERVVAEDSLLESEERYRQLIQNIPVGLYRCTHGATGKFIMSNPAMSRMFRYETLMEKIGLTMLSLFVEPKRREEIYAKLEKEGSVIDEEVLFRRRDGTTFWGAVTAKLVRSPSGEIMFCDGMIEDVTERRRIEEMKSDFVSLVSHQLKTPVAEIKGFIFNMLSGITGELNSKQRMYLEQMQEIAARNYRLISDLLNVSRIERGVISVDLKVTDLKEIVDGSLEGYYQMIKDKNLALTLYGMENEVLVMADKDKCVEAIGNVISNAIKFTAQGGITLRVKSDARYGIIEVEDTGPGISSETLEHLFQKETALAGAPKAGGGAGLGLYIGKNFMLVQKGDVTVESSPGAGTKFTFKIPLAQV